MSLDLLETYLKELQNIITGLTMMGEDEIASDSIFELNRYINPFVGGRSTFQIGPMPAPTQEKEIPVKDVVFEVNNDNVPAVSSGTPKKEPLKRKMRLPITTSKDESCQVNDLKVTNRQIDDDHEYDLDSDPDFDDAAIRNYLNANPSNFGQSGTDQRRDSGANLSNIFTGQQTRNQNNSTPKTTSTRNNRPWSGNKTAPTSEEVVTSQKNEATDEATDDDERKQP